MRQSEGISKRGKRSIPKVGGEIAETEEGDSRISQTIQQNQGVFRVYLKVQDVLRNIVLKNVKGVGHKLVISVNTFHLLSEMLLKDIWCITAFSSLGNMPSGLQLH